MFDYTYQGVQIHSNKKLDLDTQKKYLHYIQEKNRGKEIQEFSLSFSGDSVHISADITPIPFEHIRRITGYLVGTLDKFNDGKKAEEHDRVKHLTGANYGLAQY